MIVLVSKFVDKVFYYSWAQPLFTISTFPNINLEFWDITIVVVSAHPYLHPTPHWLIWYKEFCPCMESMASSICVLTMRVIRSSPIILVHASLFQFCHNWGNLAVLVSWYQLNGVVCVFQEIYHGLSTVDDSAIKDCMIFPIVF